MDLEQQLRESYVERLGALDLPGGDVAAARRTGGRMRARRRLAAGAAAVAAVAVALGGTLVGTGRLAVGPSQGTGHWRELPAAPLSPRTDALTVWTGHEVLVVGGETKPCPPNASCVATPLALRDGAAYDPASNKWTSIAPAPVGVAQGDRLVAGAGFVVLQHWLPHGSEWFTFESPPRNRWTRIRGVPQGIGPLSVLGTKVYAIAGRHVVVYDQPRGEWTSLPVDPITPSLTQRAITATASGPVVTGLDSTQPNDGIKPSLVLADVYDGTNWHRLSGGDLLGNGFSWTGTRMVDPDPFSLDGGEVDNWGRSYPQGGTLDPATGTWGSLPDALVNPPDGGREGWGVSAVGGSWFAVLGQAYDDSTGRVYRLERPNGAPTYGTASAWADGRLLVFGGTDFHHNSTCRGPAAACAGMVDLTDHAWLWTP